MKTAKALTTAFAIGTQLLGTVLKANPIGLIISGVGALVAGLTIAYQKHEGLGTLSIQHGRQFKAL